MEMTKETFSNLFADQLNRLDLAFDVLAAGLENGYGGKVEFELSHSNSAFVWANLYVEAECDLSWGNGWSEWRASGKIEWGTSSNHYVRFEFSREQYGEIKLDQIIIHDDDSECFYPWIIDVCSNNQIHLAVEAQPQEDEEQMVKMVAV